MIKEQELLNMSGCPKCGSTNIQFRRENQGEVRGKNYKQVVHRTVGYCKDCGETWYSSSESEMPKKRKTWLWVLGWICIFPVPLTILMLRKKYCCVRSVDVAHCLQRSKPPVSAAVSRLVGSGLLRVEEDGNLLLTEQGMNYMRDYLERSRCFQRLRPSTNL